MLAGRLCLIVLLIALAAAVAACGGEDAPSNEALNDQGRESKAGRAESKDKGDGDNGSAGNRKGDGAVGRKRDRSRDSSDENQKSVYEQARSACNDAGSEQVAEQAGVDPGSDRDVIAEAYAKQFGNDPSAAFEGCREGLG